MGDKNYDLIDDYNPSTRKVLLKCFKELIYMPL